MLFQPLALDLVAGCRGQHGEADERAYRQRREDEQDAGDRAPPMAAAARATGRMVRSGEAATPNGTAIAAKRRANG